MRFPVLPTQITLQKITIFSILSLQAVRWTRSRRLIQEYGMISREFAQFFIDRHAADERFVKIAKAMGAEGDVKPQDFITKLIELQKACGVENLKMSDYGFEKSECMKIARNARETMGGLYPANPCEMTDEDVAGVLERSYR